MAKKAGSEKRLTVQQRDALLRILSERFAKNGRRHAGIEWDKVESRLLGNEAKLWSLSEMEASGGEPDVIGQDKGSGAYIFCDCSAESPAGRRSLCYDGDALASRKEHKPKDSALGLAGKIGVELLDENQYRELQQLGEFDLKTSSWLKTPARIRKLGGALFGDRRFDHVFIYHNGAESYYAARGFRGRVLV